MSELTASSIHLETLLNRADRQTIQRGQTYYAHGRVSLQELTKTEATLLVRGTSPRPYQVDVWANNGSARFSCDCPIAEGDPRIVCKHVVAAALGLHGHLETRVERPWDDLLQKAAREMAGRKAEVAPHALFFSLQRRNGSWGVYPYSLPLSLFPEEVLTDPEARARFVKAERLSRQAKPVRTFKNPAMFPLVSDAARAALHLAGLASQYSYSYYSENAYAAGLFLPALAGEWVFRGTQQEPLLHLTRIRPGVAVPSLDISRTQDGMRISAALTWGGERTVFDEGGITLLSQDPYWLLLDQEAVGVAGTDPAFEVFLQNPALVVPESHIEDFAERYLLLFARKVGVTGDAVSEKEIGGEPKPRLYLSEAEGEFQAALRFGYGDFEIPAGDPATETTVSRRPDSLTLVRVHRQAEPEEAARQALSGFGLKRGAQPGFYALRASTDLLDFLLHQIPRLTEAGFEIFGERDLRSARVNRHAPTLKFSVSSGIDWFDLNAVVQYGDTEASLRDLRRAVKRREKYLKLADGTMGEIPQEWIDRFKPLFALAEEGEDGLRVSSRQVALVELALAEAESADLDGEFERQRERLRGFERIDPVAPPQGLNGELRPYQKAAVDWLHFLHGHGFGGCLADDMGTGKTITTLAFLQSLCEQGKLTRPALLVLPRSLVFNWEREAAKFTPGLRVLNHAHAARSKELAGLEQADLVLTTYGVLLRDIDRLRKYPFHLAILDEAQAIKNPESQSSKAVRLLQADHRLSLTGTPIENSTLELWSQFRFLNPGLLGPLETFRAEFVNPIERGQEGAAVQLLHALVRPFLLRRTKDQVATDLPPRTERQLYSEMEAAQRKLYQQTRDRYRAQILGLMDEGGMPQARMTILEGLLRLRQICCHPRLVEPGTRAESAKLEQLLETLETLQAEGHKCLIFSQFVQMLKIIGEALDARKIPYLTLTGQTKDRQSRVDQFQTDPAIPFFLISLKAGGVGLNLTAADYVIHVDPWWNPAVERQASDRTHRIGQDKPVFVYQMVTKDSVEEKVRELQERKQALADQLITSETGLFKSLTRQDINALFT